jgi:hypothetical protein
MKLETCQKQRFDPMLRNSVVISYRISPKLHNWLKTNKLSPKIVFFEACKELGYTHKETAVKANVKRNH